MNDTDRPHVMVARNADVNNVLKQPILPGPSPLAKAYFANQQIAAFDGKKHKYSIEWDCGGKLLLIYQDGQQLLYTSFDPAVEFTDPTKVKWGFTAARGPVSGYTIGGTQISIWNAVVQQSRHCEKCNTPYVDLSFEHGNCTDQNEYYLTVSPAWQVGYTCQVTNFNMDMGDGSSMIKMHYQNTGFYTYVHTYTNPGTYTISTSSAASGEECECVGEADITFDRPDCWGWIPLYEWHEQCWNDDPQLKTSLQDSSPISENNEASGIAVYNELNKGYMHLYPNPTTGDLKIETLQPFRSVSLVDVTGRTVFNHSYTDINSKTIDLSSLPGGLYLITTTGADGKQYKDKVQIQK